MEGSQTGTQPSNRSIFGEDGKLSSASAATSLKYAKAQDLPSFPSVGLQMSSAGAAASLASSNRKSFEHWKPDPVPAANKAALLAKDYEMEPLWQPQASAAGSKAAMLAHSNTAKVGPPSQVIEPRTRTLANTRPISSTAPASPPTMYVSPEIHRKALLAATASHSRTRSGSAPQPVDKSISDSQWALKAATKSHKAGPTPISGPFTTGDPGFEAARIQNLAKNNVDKRLYTSAPPVSIEVQEKNRQDMLKASAIAMAQKMYAIQQRQIDEAAGQSASAGQALAASRARSSTVTGSSVSVSDDMPVMGGYENLEEAARKLAQQRLAKIHDEHAEYRNYYVQQTSPSRSRLSTRMRGRASSAADADDSDEEDSRRIRSQMSIFTSKLAEVDSKKRQQDRDNLLEIAHRNVDARIRQIDDKVFQQTGKASPAQMEQWEKSAREKAQQDSDERMKYAGKVHIGGGKYLEQSELDAIAKARLQPTLDEISEKAERMRAKDEADRLERERLQAEAQAEKARQAETAAALKKLKEQQKQEEKARKDEEKRVLREQQAELKLKRDEQLRLLKESQNAEREKRKSKETKSGRLSALFGAGGGAATGAAMGATAAEASTAGVAAAENTERSGVESSVPYEQIREGQTFHDQVTSPTALAEQTTVLTQAGSHDQATAPVTTNTTHEQVALPTVLTLTADPEPSISSPVTSQVVPTTTATTTANVGRPSAEGEKAMDYRKSIDSENETTQSPNKSSSRIKSWMKVKFGGKSNTQKDGITPTTQSAAAGQSSTSAASQDAGLKATSMHDVAMAGKSDANELDDKDVLPLTEPIKADTSRRSASISSLSSSAYSGEAGQAREAKALSVTQADSEGEDRGRTGFTQRILKKVKPNKDNTTDGTENVQANTTEDEFEEARDTFEEEKLAFPPSLSTMASQGKGSDTVNPKHSKDGSRFTEEL